MSTLEIGTKVLLKVCPHGQPGTVIRIERSRAVVFWHDLNYLARHQPESLMEAKNVPSITERSVGLIKRTIGGSK
jgi:hypothetical protein